MATGLPYLLGGCRYGSQALDTVRAETGPVLAISLNYWGLNIAQCHNVVTSLFIGRDIDEVVLKAGAVEGLLGGIALDTCWLGVNGDRHIDP